MTEDSITISTGPPFQTAMILAIIADALQIIIFPAFVEGAISPADAILDFGIAALLINLLGWHWEFLPAFLADALQIIIFPAFVEGAISPADAILDFGIAALLINLLGWHWEFLPAFLA